MASSPPRFKLVATVASEAMGIGKSSDVLTVLGGKASCRRKFVLNLHLLDDHGNLAAMDMSIVASVAYAHDHTLVVRDDKQFLAEPPLFTTFNGVEFPAQERPTRMVSGRASFKLAISLLSSKCDNRLFCICFTPQLDGDATVICDPCYSKPIRSISRKRTQSSSSLAAAPPPALTIPPPLYCDDDVVLPHQQQQHKVITSPGSSSENYDCSARRSFSNGGRASTAAAASAESCPVHGSTILVDNTLKNGFCGFEKSSSLSLSLSPTSESGSPSSVVDHKLPELLDNVVAGGGQQQQSHNTARAFRPYARFSAPAAGVTSTEFSAFARAAAEASSQNSPLRHLATGLNHPIMTPQQNGTNNNKSEPSLEEEEKSLHYIEVSLQEVHMELQRRKEELFSKKRRLLEDDTRMHSIIFQSSSWIESLLTVFGMFLIKLRKE